MGRGLNLVPAVDCFLYEQCLIAEAGGEQGGGVLAVDPGHVCLEQGGDAEGGALPGEELLEAAAGTFLPFPVLLSLPVPDRLPVRPFLFSCLEYANSKCYRLFCLQSVMDGLT